MVVLIPVSRVFRYERRPLVSPLTDSSSCLLQIPILNKSKQISIFGPYHPFEIFVLLMYYCLSSDHKCGGEIFLLHSHSAIHHYFRSRTRQYYKFWCSAILLHFTALPRTGTRRSSCLQLNQRYGTYGAVYLSFTMI